jgi:hypothetical protein
MLFTKGGESSLKRSLLIPFLAIYAKGGESMSSKQKDRTTTAPPPISKILVFQFGFKELISNWYTLFKINIKTLLNTKRRILLRGSFVLVKGKAF